MSLVVPSLRGIVASAPWAKNELWRKAQAVPSLDLRFADGKSLTDAVSGQNLITFTRASSGTYVGSDGLIKTALANAPRFDHNPVTGESLGLLIEEQRTNLLTYSEQVDDASWSKAALLPFGSGSIANASSSPDGIQTADKITEDTSNAEHQVSRFYNITTSVTYTVSLYVKSAGRTFCRFGFTGTGFAGLTRSIFNLTAGTVALDAGGSPTITPVGNGWYRLTVTNTATSTTTASIIIQPVIDESTVSYTGDGTSGLYLWGAQLEAGAFPTSYIPTTSATVTRNADVASITGANFSSWYRQDEGTVFAEITGYPIAPSQFPRIFEVSDGTSNNSIRIQQYSTSSVRASIINGGVIQMAQDGGAILKGSQGKTALAFVNNDCALVVDGGAQSVDTSVTLATNMTQSTIGATITGTSAANSTISRLAFFNRRLPDATLESITSP